MNKNTIYGVVLVVGVVIVAILFLNKSKEPVETVVSGGTIVQTNIAPGTYTVVDGVDVVAWSAGKTFIKGYVDTGAVSLSDGSITVNDEGNLTGTFVANTTTIHAVSTGVGKGEDMLTNHLQSADFLDVATHPTATFSIKTLSTNEDATELIAAGDLTVKGITKEVSFPVQIENEDGVVHITAQTSIDRTQWGIVYASGSVFDNLADKTIDDNVKISVDVRLEATN